MNESFTPSWYTFRRNDDHVLFYKLEENKMSIFEVTDYQSWLRITCLTFFQGGACPITPMVSPRDCRFSSKSVLKNVPAYLQSRSELHSSVFEEIHERRFFLKKEFIQPILYGTHYYLDIHHNSLGKRYWKIFPHHLCLY